MGHPQIQFADDNEGSQNITDDQNVMSNEEMFNENLNEP